MSDAWALPASGTPRRWGLLVVALVLVLFKLWLVSAQTVQAIGDARHDDWLFLKLASALVRGQWLGAYDEITLAKGPFYSMFIAASFVLGIPLFTAQHLLYVGACGLLVAALRPWVSHRGVLLAMFAVLLFNPVTYDASAHLRVLRQNLTPALSLTIVAALIGMHGQRAATKVRRLLPWAFSGGIALAAFWLTREDVIWILPAFILPWSMTLWITWREAAPDRTARLALVSMPMAMLVSGLLVVSSLNWLHYGVFTTCEFRHRDFKRAYGALLGVGSASWHRYVPLSHEARERIYGVSPAFAELRPHLEGELGDGRAIESAKYLPLPPGREIGGGWFVWALREAVAAAGHARSGAEAMRFYSTVAEEVGSALDRGALAGSGRRSGFLPPMRIEHVEPFVAGIEKSVIAIGTFSGLSVTPKPSSGPREATNVFADLTRTRLSPYPDEPGAHFHQRVLDHVRLPILHGIGASYAIWAPWWGAAALIAWAAALVLSAWKRRLSYLAVMSTGLSASCLALAAGVTLVEITSFPAIDPMYLTGAYGFWLAFLFLAVLALWDTTAPRWLGCEYEANVESA